MLIYQPLLKRLIIFLITATLFANCNTSKKTTTELEETKTGAKEALEMPLISASTQIKSIKLMPGNTVNINPGFVLILNEHN